MPDAADGRTFLMAIMHVSGFRNCDIAKHLGYTDAWVSTKLSSPLMRAQIADLQSDLRSSTISDAMETIERGAPIAAKLLLESIENGENYSVRQRGAEALLDRHPKFAKRTHHEEEHTVRLVLSTADVKQMMAAHPPAGAGVIDVEGASPEFLPLASVGVGIRSLDESIRSAEEALAASTA